jgi:hypothetical protein
VKERRILACEVGLEVARLISKGEGTKAADAIAAALSYERERTIEECAQECEKEQKHCEKFAARFGDGLAEHRGWAMSAATAIILAKEIRALKDKPC